MEESIEVNQTLTRTLVEFLAGRNLSVGTSEFIGVSMALLLFALVVFLLVWIRRRFLRDFFQRITSKTSFSWDDLLSKHGVLTWGANIIISIIIITLSKFFFGDLMIGGLTVGTAITSACYVYFIITVLLAIDSALNALVEFYGKLPISKDIGIKGFIQAVKLITFLVGLVFILSTILNKSPVVFLSGIGALTAVLLLIFKDAILGFVAGIQISVNRMVRVGDWVEMPTHLADGDVIDISLTTVKIQNWDKTITSIPTYDLISKPFKNWKGMQKSGGRRIKRAIMIDKQTIKFADEALLKKLGEIQLIVPYLESKAKELDDFNRENQITDLPKNGRAITNIGTFRAYCEAYLKAHPKVHKGMTLLVRQLSPSPKGLPIEIYVFTNDTNWGNYEAIQSDIFDHLFALLPHFELAAYQEPSGNDLKSLIQGSNGN